MQTIITMQDMLRGLWREIDAEGGVTQSEYERGLCAGLEIACRKLEAAGFGENQSTAADLIDEITLSQRELVGALRLTTSDLTYCRQAGKLSRTTRSSISKARDVLALHLDVESAP